MNTISSVHHGLFGTAARTLATIFGSLLMADASLPPVVKDILAVLLQPLH